MEDSGHPPLRADEVGADDPAESKTFDFSETMMADSCCSVEA